MYNYEDIKLLNYIEKINVFVVYLKNERIGRLLYKTYCFELFQIDIKNLHLVYIKIMSTFLYSYSIPYHSLTNN